MARTGSRRSSLGVPYGTRGSGYGSTQASPTGSAAEAEAERIAQLLREYATAARAEVVWASGTAEIAGAGQTSDTEAAREHLRDTGWLEPLESTWSRTAIASLVIPALILLIMCLVLPLSPRT
jgi:hypothetical protein